MKRIFAMTLLILTLLLFAASAALGEETTTYAFASTIRDEYGRGGPYKFYIVNEQTNYQTVAEWASSDESVMQLTKMDGAFAYFSGMGYGTCVISAKDPNGVTHTKTVRVSRPADVVFLHEQTLTLREGESGKLTYTAFGGDSSYYVTSNDKSVVKAGPGPCELIGVNHGQTYVQLCERASGTIDTCLVTVVEDENSLEVRPAGPVYLSVGESQQFYVTTHAGEPVDVTFHAVMPGDEELITGDGLVTYLKPNANYIRFYAEDKTGRRVDFSVSKSDKPKEFRLSLQNGWNYETRVFTVQINGYDAPYGLYRFTSSNESILSFPDPLDPKGWVTKTGKVKVTATATYDESVSVTEVLTIPETRTLFINESDVLLYPGQQYKFTAFSPRAGKNITPKWKTEFPSVVSVNAKGVVTARGHAVDSEGYTHDCSAIYALDSSKPDYFSEPGYVFVTVLPPPDNFYVYLEGGDRCLAPGEAAQLLAYEDRPSDVYPCTWESLNPEVATVSGRGVVTAEASGRATILCTLCTGQTDTYDIVVGDTPPETVSFPMDSITLGLGETFNLKNCIPVYEDGGSAQFRFVVGDKSIASIIDNKIFTNQKVGSTTLTVYTINGKSATIDLIVKNRPEKLAVDPSSVTVTAGEIVPVHLDMGADAAGRVDVFLSGGKDCAQILRLTDDTLAVVGMAPGKGEYLLRSFNYKTCRLSVEVKAGPTSIAFKPNTLRIPVGGEVQPKVSFKGEEVPYFLESSDPEILEVDEEDLKTVRALKPGKVTLTASTLNGKTAKCTVTVFESVHEIDLTGSPETVQIGKTVTLAPVVLPENAENKKVTYTSSNKKIATVTAKGVVKGVKAGKVTITVTAADGSGTFATLDIEVIPPVKVTAIDLSGTPETLRVGKTLTLAPTVLPEDAANKKVKYVSSNKKIATVSEKGVVKGVKAGKVTITVKAADGSGVSSSIDLEILPPVKVESIDLSGTPETLRVGKTLTLAPLVLPEDAANRKVKYTSSNKKIATVSTKGVVKGLKPGNVTITVKAADGSGVSSSIDLEILPPVKVETIDLSGNPETLSVGKKLTLVKTVLPEDAANKKVKYISSNKKIATVSEKGVVKGLKAGTVTITVKAADGSGVTAVWEITVVSGKATPQPEAPEPEAQEPEAPKTEVLEPEPSKEIIEEAE